MIKIKLLVLCVCLCATFTASAQKIDYDSMRTAIIVFFNETEEDFTDRGVDNILLIRNAVTHYQIGDERDYEYSNYTMEPEVKEGMYSIFPMSSFSEYTYYHFLLVGKDDFQIINMRKPIQSNLKLIIDFLQNPVYTKEDVLLYLQNFIRIYERNAYD